MKVISFLGTGAYKPTTYTWGGQECTTRFFPVAMAHFIQPEQLLVCVTPTVAGHTNLSEMGADLDAAGVSWQPVHIPEGHSETDLWSIFNALTGVVEQGEQVIIDVTHSFRSLPFLAFLAVAYLRTAKQVQVQRVLYGAWEARQPQSEPPASTDRAPVFDLTPFVGLLDWTNATGHFTETGESAALADLLRRGMPSGPQMGQDLEMRDLGKKLKNAADSLQEVSLALQVTRPLEVMNSAAHLSDSLNRALPVISRSAPPFALLAEKIIAEYGQFGLQDAGRKENLTRNLRLQLQMIHWYNAHNRVVQAATLLREWIVSVLALYFEAPLLDYENGRRPLEMAINNAVERRKPAPNIRERSPFDRSLETLDDIDRICTLWSRATRLRNDIAHVGMRSEPEPAAHLKQKVEELLPELDYLADALLPPTLLP